MNTKDFAVIISATLIGGIIGYYGPDVVGFRERINANAIAMLDDTVRVMELQDANRQLATETAVFREELKDANRKAAATRLIGRSS